MLEFLDFLVPLCGGDLHLPDTSLTWDVGHRIFLVVGAVNCDPLSERAFTSWCARDVRGLRPLHMSLVDRVTRVL